MKSIYLFVLIFLLGAVSAFSQDIHNNWFLAADGQISYRSVSYPDNPGLDITERVIGVSPRIGFAVTPFLVAGADLGYSRTRYQQENDVSTLEGRGHSYSAGPFVRCFLAQGVARPFLEAEANFGRFSFVLDFEDEADIESKNNIAIYAAGGGLAIFLTDNISLDAGVFFERMNIRPVDAEQREEGTLKSNSLALRLGFSLFL